MQKRSDVRVVAGLEHTGWTYHNKSFMYDISSFVFVLSVYLRHCIVNPPIPNPHHSVYTNSGFSLSVKSNHS